MLRKVLDRLRHLVHDPSFPAPGEVSRFRLLVLYLIRGTIQVSRESMWDRLTRQAAALSFQTIFSTVPLVVISLTFLTTFVSGQRVEEIAEWLSAHMLPVQAQAIAPEVQRIAAAVDVHALGLAGGVGLVFMAATLFLTLSSIVDDIWRVRRKRAVHYRLAAAAVVLVLLPSLVGLSVYLDTLLDYLPMNIDLIVSLALNATGLFLTFRYVPSAKVEPYAAAVAAIVVGLLFELGKVGFGIYVSRVGMTIRGIYGAIGIVPLSLLWIYLMWVFFLFGVELSYTVQNLPELWARDTGKDRTDRASAEGR
jgi:membrane protein